MARPDSIRMMGLKKYLDNSKDRHNGFGYDRFVELVRVPKPPSVSSLARIFNVSDITIRKWMTVLELEQKRDAE